MSYQVSGGVLFFNGTNGTNGTTAQPTIEIVV